MNFFKCYDSLLQVPFCEDESVQLFRVAFFRSDFLQNPYFSDLKSLEHSWPAVLNFKSFSQSLEQFFLTVGQNNSGSKIPQPISKLRISQIIWSTM